MVSQYNKLLIRHFTYLFAQVVCRTYIQDAAAELDISVAPESHSFQRSYQTIKQVFFI